MPYKDPVVAAEYSKQYREKNKDKLKQQAHLKYLGTKDEVKHRSKEWVKAHFEYALWKRAKDSSKQRCLEFTITSADIVIPDICPYLNIPLTKLIDGGRQDTNASLDRIDNTKGYTPDNIQVISSKANFMKRNASIAELQAFARGILNVHPES